MAHWRTAEEYIFSISASKWRAQERAALTLTLNGTVRFHRLGKAGSRNALRGYPHLDIAGSSTTSRRQAVTDEMLAAWMWKESSMSWVSRERLPSWLEVG